MKTSQVHYRNCNICEAMCGLEIHHADGEVIAIKGDKQDPFSRGHLCPKAIALQDYHQDPERLQTPLKKVDGTWQAISWEEAFDEVVSKFQKIQAQYGPNSLASYIGNPNAHNLGSATFLPPFLRALGTINRYSSASADQLPHHVAANFMLGAGMLIPVPDIDHTDFMLIVGGNPLVSNGSMMTAPDIKKRLLAIQDRGGKIVVIDPRKTETAKLADQHFFINPESDALLLLAMINVLFSEEKISLGHLSELITDIEALQSAVEYFSPEGVANRVGIEASAIRQLAIEMAEAPSAVCYSRMGASTQSFGGLCQWLTNAFNILTGNFDSRGGAMFPLPAFDLLAGKKGKKNSYNRYQSRVRGLPYFNGEFPVATLADEINTQGEGQIKALITIAGNPVLSSPGGNRLNEAFAKLEFMVSVDIYLNETTRHADIILPAATGLEIEQYDVFFNAFAVRNTAKYSPALFEAKGQQKKDWEILKELTLRLTGTVDNGASPEVILEKMLSFSAYKESQVNVQKLKENPHGLDLGPLQPCLKRRLMTDDGLIKLAPEFYINDLPRLTSFFDNEKEASREFPFRLISRRLVRSHNTWTQNSWRLVKGKNPCTVQINEDDAASLTIKSGQLVKVISRNGEITLPAELTPDMGKGVISIPQGWGHGKSDTKMTIAAKQPGISINDITDPQRIDELTGNAAFNGTRVKIIPA
ncbi:molybdopterin-dependent oxidoreductase [Aliikangiella marina]|uniref:Molybdopterin-dependent oxidoreductase n=2 Tax=Aliikangiella marina TaxID=1712262 RepID=A0A545T7I8_9GAMM|nr:molybdopterin-dependent oxidoreductase [Aliikangiella marina]